MSNRVNCGKGPHANQPGETSAAQLESIRNKDSRLNRVEFSSFRTAYIPARLATVDQVRRLEASSMESKPLYQLNVVML